MGGGLGVGLGEGEECSKKNDTRRTQKLDNHTSQI